MIDTIFRIAFTVLASAVLTGASFKMFQIFQLSGYRTRGVYNWFKATKLDYLARYFALGFLSFIAIFVFIGSFGSFPITYYIGSFIFFGLCAMFILISFKSGAQSKTPLKLTKRVWRLIITSAILHAALVYGLLMFGTLLPKIDYAFACVAAFLIPFTVTAAHYILLPIEILIQNSFKKQAAQKLSQNPQLIKIGITGSFGKTTAKNIVAAMLEKKYKVYATPASYNTPMGIAKSVNSGGLQDAQVFVAEMGARYVGDIAELAHIVKPQYGILTGIGTQHLETMGSGENIAKTKYELIESLPNSGCAFFNGDNEKSVELFTGCTKEKILCGAETVSGASVTYKNAKMQNKGSVFTLIADGREIEITTVLLGKHIPGLIALCAAAALKLEVSLEEIAAACAELKPVPHRLQLIDRGDTLILDDAYNANAEGARNALEVLSQLDGTRIIITPGLV
ncbi:MAG: UDP-N-acetylmuramoyl-tripeptide--D-alanyl-D-alanine ligase [Firmicutes bacterium]|nr:UDP-N-acetylmuramoyl-tripeptide--D-alanyl-D-alanine ligase [Bacillota bacterium]